MSALFAVNDLVYFVPAARKGILEKHCIKKVLTRKEVKTNYGTHYLYKDTWNRYYNEDELATLNDAQAIIDAL